MIIIALLMKNRVSFISDSSKDIRREDCVSKQYLVPLHEDGPI